MVAKQLPLAESPIKGYMMYSYHLAVTFSHVQALPWFYNNFVQLQCDPAQLSLSDLLDFSTMPKGEVHFTEGTSIYNPWLSSCPQLNEELLASHDGLISNFVLKSIGNDFYVETFVDEYYISPLFNGNNIHFGHRLLVFGYDDRLRMFDIMGFDKNSQYRKLQCSYDELNTAFAAADPYVLDRTKLFKPNAADLPAFVFDLEKLTTLLRDYLGGKNTILNPDLRGTLKEGNELWYGTRAFQFLQEYVLKSIEAKASGADTVLDIRGFYIMWEHKKCMLDRIKWLFENGYRLPTSAVAEYGRVVGLAELSRNRIVMCRRGFLPMGKGHLKEVPRLLEEAKKIEIDVLESVVSSLMH